jgi:cellulose synthase/poly-beta-1,6-N-acetylglucosamine synthase-like glycosyltransferase
LTTVLFVAGTAWVVLVAWLVLVLLAQVLAGWRARAPAPHAAGLRVPAYTVLMPAHDEAGTIGPVIAAVRQQLPEGARLLVVADNCRDTTAGEARAAGAEVVERHDPVLRGKGHALAFGMAHLRGAAPELVIVLDADCIPAEGALDRIAAAALAAQRPVQALYLMTAPAGSSLRVRMAAFAWALRNQVRPLGMHRLGLPCQLMGSGMAFPWSCVSDVDFASGHITEDLQLGLKLAASGRAPRFCPDALVESWFPVEAAALDSQRTRWEHGHLSMILSALPMLLQRIGRRGGGAALALGADLCIPPLALLALLVAASCVVGGSLAVAAPQGWIVAAIAAVAAAGFATAIVLAWWSVGRRWVQWRELVSAPAYVLRKLPVYAAFLLRRQKEWVRTSRQR